MNPKRKKHLLFLWQFFKSKTFWSLVFKAFLISFALLFVFFQIISLYTRHMTAFKVPDFTGKTLIQADSIAKANKFNLRLVDSVFYNDSRKNIIVSQYPLPNSDVKKWRTINVIKNSSKSKKLRMPELVGISLLRALNSLKNNGLKLGRIIYKPNISVNIVLKQEKYGREVEAGSNIDAGNVIDLVVGQGLSDAETTVPIITGMVLKDAKDNLDLFELSIGAVVKDNTITKDEDFKKAIIWKQYPVSDESKTVKMGSAVDVWVTLDTTKVN